jgi:hypothetical protein
MSTPIKVLGIPVRMVDKRVHRINNNTPPEDGDFLYANIDVIYTIVEVKNPLKIRCQTPLRPFDITIDDKAGNITERLMIHFLGQRAEYGHWEVVDEEHVRVSRGDDDALE